MPRAALRLALVAPLLVGCQSTGRDLPDGRIDAREYRSLAADDGLTYDEGLEAGLVDDGRLADLHAQEGGAAAPQGQRCLYAVTLYRRTVEDKQYRGTARFCFGADDVVTSVDRRRADLRGTPSPPALP